MNHKIGPTKIFRTISEIHDAFDRKILSPIELVRDYFSRIGESEHNAYITCCEEKALLQAKKSDQILARHGNVPRERMPLFGIPLGIKDNMVTQGVRTTCASKALENYMPPYTATAVQKLEDAGAVLLGKLNLDEFAMGGSNENSAWGPVRHPTHPDRVPGGSSGGSATAVRAHLCLASLGSDTGGSIRLPASYCGVVGLKPTYGAVSRYGLVAFASSLDQIGPFANTVDDVSTLFKVIRGYDPKDSTSLDFRDQGFNSIDWNKTKIGIFSEDWASIQPEIRQTLDFVLQIYQSLGAQIVPVKFSTLRYSIAVYYLIAVSEASSNLARFDGIRYGVRPESAMQSGQVEDFYECVRSLFGAEVKRRMILGTFALSSGYQDAYYRRACQVRRLIAQEFAQCFRQVDWLISPVSATTAFRLGEKYSDPLQMYLNDLFTIPANLAGLPSLSVPAGADTQGLPIGLQLTGPAWSEERLFAAARVLQEKFR